MILALDLGTQMGYAMLVDGQIVSGSMCFKPGRFEGGGMRYVRFSKWLAKLENVERVYFEEVRRHMSTDAAHCYGGFMAIMTGFCDNRKIPYHGVHWSAIKIHATGRGNAKKQDMIEAAVKLGYRPIDDNEADAIHLLRHALDVLE